MIKAIADTHAVIWYLSSDPRLSPPADRLIEEARLQGETIGISTISLVEMIYLTEKHKIPMKVYQSLLRSLVDADSLLKETPVDRGVAITVSKIPRLTIPDMPDRIIAATALHLGVPLISRDSKIKLSKVKTIW